MNVLFFNPPTRKNVYFDTNIKVGAPSYPSLTLATLAGHLVKKHKVKIIDLDLYPDYREKLLKTIKKFKPDIVATTAKTTEYTSAWDLMVEVKKNFPKIKTILGGVHATALPKEVALEECFDIIAFGEGDTVIPEILQARSLRSVPGIAYKDESGNVVFTRKRELIKDINKLPYPSWNLYDLKAYRNSRLSCRQNPVGHIETSRGCSYRCNFCSKLIFGTVYRIKTPKRVVDEMEYMLKCGFGEIHITDDSFTQNIVRAKEVCREIIGRKLKFPWSLINGVRVNLVDEEFFQLAKQAGCWQVGFGIETGDQRVLNRINKQITLTQIRNAVSLAQKSGIDTFGFFIFGLSGETEKSMVRTVSFAKSLPLSTAKFDICIPYPGTQYYKDLDSQNRIICRQWSRYNVHQAEVQLFKHPTVPWDRLNYYYKRGFREFYFRPKYIIKRFFRDVKTGDLLYDLYYLLKTFS